MTMKFTGGSSLTSSRVLAKDLLASVVVFLVALPLCMGIAIASGLPATAGFITGIIGGLIVGAIAGSPLQVSGPAAGLAVLVYQLVETYGIASLGTIILFAGVIQIVAAWLQIGQWFRAVSPAVIHGMLAGIGVLIFASQVHVMLDGAPKGSGLENLISIPGAIVEAFQSDGTRIAAGGVGLLTIIAIIGWTSFAPKQFRMIPGPLVGVCAGMGAAAIFGLEQIKYVNVPDNIWSTVIFPTTETLSAFFTDHTMIFAAFAVAIIASAETLLCATAVDQMHSGPRTRYDQELLAQGVGNSLCGALGALPMTGVIVRSSANVEAGAVTRSSAILHGVWLLLFVSVLPWTLSYIPVAVLAAVLVYTGYKLAYPKILPTLLEYGRIKVFIYVATITTIIATDLLKGVMVGVALSLFHILYGLSRLDITLTQTTGTNRTDIYLTGTATVLNLPKLATALESLPPRTQVIVHVADLDFIDHACIDLLQNWEKQHRATGGSLDLDWSHVTSKYQGRNGKTGDAANGELQPAE